MISRRPRRRAIGLVAEGEPGSSNPAAMIGRAETGAVPLVPTGRIELAQEEALDGRRAGADLDAFAQRAGESVQVCLDDVFALGSASRE